MKKILVLFIVTFAISGCQFFKSKSQVNNPHPKRVIAQTKDNHYHSNKIINTFNDLMNEPLYKTDGKGQKQEAFIVRVRNYVERQFDFLYIGQSLMHDFDSELDRLIVLKKKNGKLTDEDTQKINMLYFQLQVARIVYEENLHQLSDLYLMTLETRLTTDINGDLDLKTKTTLVLSQLPMWLDEARDKKFTIGAIAVADAINDVNIAFIASTPAAARYTINVDRFVKLTLRARQQAYLESKDPKVLSFFKRLSAHIEGSAQKRYEEEIAEQEKNPEKLMLPFFENEKPRLEPEEKRKPNAVLDDLYPSADGHGHISGKYVPANTWAITLDDGPHPTHTPGMIKLFNDNKVPVTFFWLSKNMNLHPQLVAQARGNFKTTGNHFNVASHSMSHANLPTLNEKQLEVEITDAAALFEKIVGERPTLFRCPYGACGPMGSPIRQIIAKNNMIHVHWSVDPLDWQDKNPQSIVDRTQKQIELRGKGIILFHDVHPQSVEALKILVPYMKSKKYRLISMPQMVTEIREKEFYSP